MKFLYYTLTKQLVNLIQQCNLNTFLPLKQKVIKNISFSILILKHCSNDNVALIFTKHITTILLFKDSKQNIITITLTTNK